MRDLIVQWLTQITAPFWKSSLSIDQFITALQETFHMVFFGWCIKKYAKKKQVEF